MRKGTAALLSVLCLVAPGLSASAQSKVDLQPAWVDGPDGGEIIYVGYQPKAALPPQVIAITFNRSNPGDPFNSPSVDANEMHRYLQERSPFKAQDLVAISSSRDQIRIFLNAAAAPAKFDHPRATMATATDDQMAQLRSIGLPQFGRYLGKAGSRTLDLQRQFYGKAAGEPRPTDLHIRAAAKDPSSAAELERTIRKHKAGNGIAVKTRQDQAAIDITATMTFDEAALAAYFQDACELVEQSGGRCVNWSANLKGMSLGGQQ